MSITINALDRLYYSRDISYRDMFEFSVINIFTKVSQVVCKK